MDIVTDLFLPIKSLNDGFEFLTDATTMKYYILCPMLAAFRLLVFCFT
jgi:hypothetical protein